MKKIDFKKEYKELYAPKCEATMVDVPPMKFIMVDGQGDPNDLKGEYSHAVELLYALSYTIKMKCLNYEDSEVFDYVVLPLEGLWWLEDSQDMDYTRKDNYHWISMVRQPDFIDDAIFNKAKLLVAEKKPKLDVTKARFDTFTEGPCVQCMHIGPYSEEPATLAKIDSYIKENNKTYAIGALSSDKKILRHHEIYLSDPRKSNPVTMQTILRHPIQ